eukprot:gnl/TRDRNA2_/TRDRNA2_150197_c0_seq1.p1 gnl/TRDRNA2_/TRDRNA2_150197_c0~~gnl/TRDRNA2_/TRDRNA2_150197_c0_seq1.p1  ORF type:complete len:436 (+),score=50.17 gnl/TRDRNA2_/TRDRNA2_150197_c0_seq1:61-1368(+)
MSGTYWRYDRLSLHGQCQDSQLIRYTVCTAFVVASSLILLSALAREGPRAMARENETMLLAPGQLAVPLCADLRPALHSASCLLPPRSRQPLYRHQLPVASSWAIYPSQRQVSAAAVTEEAASRAPGRDVDAEDRLVSNTYNDVQVFQCRDAFELRKTLDELRQYPQVCISGVSNSGKSSVINSLLLKKGMAKTSSTAGKTRSIDLFLVNGKFVIADFPGLPSKDHQVEDIWQKEWQYLVRDYLEHVHDLRSFIFLHDVRWQVSKDELDFMRWMAEFAFPSSMLLLTKDDAVDHEGRNRGMNVARKKLRWKGKFLHYCSTRGIEMCRRARRQLLRYIEKTIRESDAPAISEAKVGAETETVMSANVPDGWPDLTEEQQAEFQKWIRKQFQGSIATDELRRMSWRFVRRDERAAELADRQSGQLPYAPGGPPKRDE